MYLEEGRVRGGMLMFLLIVWGVGVLIRGCVGCERCSMKSEVFKHVIGTYEDNMMIHLKVFLFYD